MPPKELDGGASHISGLYNQLAAFIHRTTKRSRNDDLFFVKSGKGSFSISIFFFSVCICVLAPNNLHALT